MGNTLIRTREAATPTERLEAVQALLRMKEWLIEAANAQRHRLHMLMNFLIKAEAVLYQSQQWDDVLEGKRKLTKEELSELRVTIDAMNRHMINSLDFVRRVASTVDIESTSTTEEVERLAWLIASLEPEDRRRLLEAVHLVKNRSRLLGSERAALSPNNVATDEEPDSYH